MTNTKYNRVLINIMHNDMHNLNIYINRIYNIFDKCSEEVQIDFIKLLFINNYEHDKLLDDLEINNINTIKKLLEWGCINNNIKLCRFVMNHKTIILENDYYYSLEEIIKGRNSELVHAINYHRIKDTYQTDSDSNDSNNSDNYDDTTDFFESSDSSDSSDDEDNIKYGKYIDPKDIIEVD